jgi:hypothetical protein
VLARSRIAAHAPRDRGFQGDDVVKLIERRAIADAAYGGFRRAEITWLRRTRTMRAWSRRHRAGLVVGSGLAAGFAAARLPVGPLLRLAFALASTAALMLEGPLLRLIAARDTNRSADASEDS